jgi:DNA-nicking Smr family endonuclease
VNFGEILEKWEHSSGQTVGDSGKKYIEEWLQDNKIHDKDANSNKISKPGEDRRRLLRTAPDDVLDIHGMTTEKAWVSLEQFFSGAKEKEFKKLRIIHGKGNHSQGDSVLIQTVRKYIEKCPFAGESGFEKVNYGGCGATWVFLKNH